MAWRESLEQVLAGSSVFVVVFEERNGGALKGTRGGDSDYVYLLALI
jgi:hypothetical protein